MEQSFGWMKIIEMLKKLKLRGIDKGVTDSTATGAPRPGPRVVRAKQGWPPRPASPAR
jgi:hypothetical protein